MKLLIKELKNYKVLDESSFEIVASLDLSRGVIDRLHYVMYRIGKKENGLQIFYQCLKETQDRASGHRDAVEILKKEGEFRVFYSRTGFLRALLSCIVILLCLAFSSIDVDFLSQECTDKAILTTSHRVHAIIYVIVYC